jgi:hypothetical protein
LLPLGTLSDEQAFGPATDGRGQDPWWGRRVGRHPGRPPRLMEGVSLEAVLEGADVGRVLAPPSVCVSACLAAKWRWLTPRLRPEAASQVAGDCFFEAVRLRSSSLLCVHRCCAAGDRVTPFVAALQVTGGEDPGHLRTRLGWFLAGDGRRSGHGPTAELLKALHARAGTEPGTAEAEMAALPAAMVEAAVQRSGWDACVGLRFGVCVLCVCCVFRRVGERTGGRP